MTQPTLRLAALCLLGLALAGCDKCTDYPWLGATAPHSCRDVAAPK